MGDIFSSGLLKKGMQEFTLLDGGRPAVAKDFPEIETICLIAMTGAVRENKIAVVLCQRRTARDTNSLF
jgi:hypothetical protein